MKLFLSSIVLISLFLLNVHNIGAQSHNFLSEDSTFVGDSPPLINLSPYKFYGNANFGGPPYTTLLWHTQGSNAMNSDFIDVINDYTDQSWFPSWIDISDSEYGQASAADITLNFASCDYGEKACINFDGLVYHYSKKVYTVHKHTLSFPDYHLSTDQEQHYQLAHELGHVLGLHEKYIETSSGTIYCSGGDYVMDALGCDPNIMGPTNSDRYNLYRYYQGCGQWCAHLEPDSNSLVLSGTTISSKWTHRHWYSLMGHIRYLKSNSQNGPWTVFHTQTPTQNLGFKEDAVPQTNDQYILNMSKNVGAMTNNDWVLICGRPMITWGVWGQEQCMPNAVYVP